MSQIAYYSADIQQFRSSDSASILGVLAQNHGFALEHPQKNAWISEIGLLKQNLPPNLIGEIYFEFRIPRMGKRADVVIVCRGIIFVIEFKVGSDKFDNYAIDQVFDYALDLKNFHKGSHDCPIVPILIATNSPAQDLNPLIWAADQVANPVCISTSNLAQLIEATISSIEARPFDLQDWATSGYQPTPTIIEAALALYQQHDVTEITRSEAGADNLGVTAKRIEQIIEHAKANNEKAICFITGVPGAGKTLAGLNLATSRSEKHSDEHAVFLSGNGPLVEVLREALARDQTVKSSIPKKDAYRKVSSFIQNIHHFRDESILNAKPPIEKVVIFDEAQRAWDKDMATKFMQQKRGHISFNMSEPDFLVSVMDRHQDWCVVICLIGGGQEINTGEAGLAEWIAVLNDHYSNWKIHVSRRLLDKDYVWDSNLSQSLENTRAIWDNDLHLGVSVRSFRAELLSEFIGHIVDNNSVEAKKIFASIKNKYPLYMTRDLNLARQWLRERARGSERYGLTASSGANRLRPDGVWMKSKIEAPVWFLNDKSDIRSSYYLEEVASEFDIQGLELDWTCVCWDANFRRSDGKWAFYKFKGATWQNVNKVEDKLHIKNTYRVLLTRARQGLVIFVPEGDANDPTRKPDFYNQIFEFLGHCGFSTIPDMAGNTKAK